MFKIYPYIAGSASVKKLKTALNAKLIKLENSSYRFKGDDIVINWGNSKVPNNIAPEDFLNNPHMTAVASNKLDTLAVLANCGVPTVPFTTQLSVAQGWLADGWKVFARTVLRGHSGNGIVVVSPSGTLPRAPLYTRGVPNCGEYRVHVFADEVILYQKKSRRVDGEGNVVTAVGADADVRNLASNWVYRTGNLKRLERVEKLAIDAINAMSLDFGAVDIIMDKDGNVAVLEINTAPGLGNEATLQAYTEAFLKFVE